MINFKRIIAGLMAGATALSFAACSSSSTSSTTDSADSNNTSTGTTIDDEIENPVSIDDISIDAGDKVEPAELQYLGCYDITTAGDVKPAYKYFSANYDCTIKCTIVGSLQILEILTTAISSGDSPDLVDYADNTFPLIMSKNMYTPLDDYMDLSARQWSGVEEYSNKYNGNGKKFYSH
ncbi:MAG: extracellular solute-binding protein, partial [Lachnospiraceae bacterium]|nr:extracellular solute-binding protein [Lachnospiraceae bacterium]